MITPLPFPTHARANEAWDPAAHPRGPDGKFTAGLSMSYRETKRLHIVDAHLPGESVPVGSIEWVRAGKGGAWDDGEIVNISVRPEHRRKGVATALFSHAKKLKTDTLPRHSKTQTPEGAAWAASMRGH